MNNSIKNKPKVLVSISYRSYYYIYFLCMSLVVYEFDTYYFWRKYENRMEEFI